MRSKLFITIIAVCFMKFGAGAQTSPADVFDLIILPVSKVSASQPIDSVLLNIMFKTDSAEIADKAILYLGTADDIPDVKQIEVKFSNVSGEIFITYSGISEPMLNFTTNISVKLSQQQYDTYSRATLYVQDINGLQTEHVYYQKH